MDLFDKINVKFTRSIKFMFPVALGTGRDSNFRFALSLKPRDSVGEQYHD